MSHKKHIDAHIMVRVKDDLNDLVGGAWIPRKEGGTGGTCEVSHQDAQAPSAIQSYRRSRLPLSIA